MSPFLELPGAVVDERHGVAAHYGAPLPEQRALAEGRAILDLSHRGVLTVSGDDRLSWLHSLLSQDIASLAPGESREALLLDPQGHIEHALRITDDGERCWVLVDEGAAASLLEFLLRMRFMLRVEVRDVSQEVVTVLAFPGDAAELLRARSPLAEWRDPWGGVVPGGTQYARGEHPGVGWGASQWVFARQDQPALAQLVRSQLTRAAGLLALDALEVCAARPSEHSEVDARALPHEFDWLRTAVHLTKGCYRGQETVAKVHNLGHPPRRVALLHLDGSTSELPQSGALVYVRTPEGGAGERPVGRVTRAALHYEWGGIALALLKRTVGEDAELLVRVDAAAHEAQSAAEMRWVAASQQAIVPADAGAVNRSRLPRSGVAAG